MGYSKKEFIKLSVSMGYTNVTNARKFCKNYPDDHVFTDNDFITVYRANAANKSILK